MRLEYFVPWSRSVCKFWIVYIFHNSHRHTFKFAQVTLCGMKEIYFPRFAQCINTLNVWTDIKNVQSWLFPSTILLLMTSVVQLSRARIFPKTNIFRQPRYIRIEPQLIRQQISVYVSAIPVVNFLRMFTRFIIDSENNWIYLVLPLCFSVNVAQNTYLSNWFFLESYFYKTVNILKGRDILFL